MSNALPDRLSPPSAHLSASFLPPEVATAYDRGASWTELVSRAAQPGQARSLTAAILQLFPELCLRDVITVIPSACSTGLAHPTPGACQTIDAGLATIDVRGPGWVDSRYPIDAVVPELKDAGFGPHDIVALFNANVPIKRLGAVVAAAFPGYVPTADDEAVGRGLGLRWRCALACCQPRRRRRLRSRLGRAGPPQLPPSRTGPA